MLIVGYCLCCIFNSHSVAIGDIFSNVITLSKNFIFTHQQAVFSFILIMFLYTTRDKVMYKLQVKLVKVDMIIISFH